MTTSGQMTNKTRNLMMKIIDNHHDVHPVAMRLYFLFDHFPPNKLDKVLTWLVSNRLTGFSFVSWFNSECKGSDLEMHRFLLSVVDNLSLNRVISGKDFRL